VQVAKTPALDTGGTSGVPPFFNAVALTIGCTEARRYCNVKLKVKTP
jgi:hypothetical protein